MSIFIPNTGTLVKLEMDCSVPVEWSDKNLPFLSKAGLTKKVVVSTRDRVFKDGNGEYQVEEIPVYRIMPNKLYMNLNGEFKPAIVSFPKNTIFELSKLIMNSTLDLSTNYIHYVDIKCIQSSKLKIQGTYLRIPLDVFNNSIGPYCTAETE